MYVCFVLPEGSVVLTDTLVMTRCLKNKAWTLYMRTHSHTHAMYVTQVIQNGPARRSSSHTLS